MIPSPSSSRLLSTPLKRGALPGRQAVSCMRLQQRHQEPQHRAYRQQAIQPEDPHPGLNDLILSILQSNPSARDTKGYLYQFGSRPPPVPKPIHPVPIHLPSETLPAATTPTTETNTVQPLATETTTATATDRKTVIDTFLNPIQRRTGVVKIQGPFTDVQLESICTGLIYLEKLGLASIIVVTRDDWEPGQEREMEDAKEDALRVTLELERQGAKARPLLEPVVRLGPKPDEAPSSAKQGDKATPSSPSMSSSSLPIEEVFAHALPIDLVGIQSALRAGEFPVVSPLALDTFCRTIRISANDVIAGLVKTMSEVGSSPIETLAKSPRGSNATKSETRPAVTSANGDVVDLTPLRLMVINREGGVPSYARTGLPHLLVNLSSEHEYIHSTFDPQWYSTHPTALSNLALAKTCLAQMPPSASATIVSHRSSRSLIANLVTNKPAQSSSLPDHLLVSGPKKLTPHTPTLIRKGSPIRVISRSNMNDLNKDKLTYLLEKSFRRTLEADKFYKRLDSVLSYVIIAGDYAGAAIVTDEVIDESGPNGPTTMAYLDKFAVHPDHQGDGTVDFLWVALHDESFGLGLAHALNPNQGGRMGVGQGKDLVWRSRTDNPANKWYFERCSGHLRIPATTPGGQNWTMFWCDAEDRLEHRRKETMREAPPQWKWFIGPSGKKERGVPGVSFIDTPERGRLDEWSRVVEQIPGSWKPIAK